MPKHMSKHMSKLYTCLYTRTFLHTCLCTCLYTYLPILMSIHMYVHIDAHVWYNRLRVHTFSPTCLELVPETHASLDWPRHTCQPRLPQAHMPAFACMSIHISGRMPMYMSVKMLMHTSIHMSAHKAWSGFGNENVLAVAVLLAVSRGLRFGSIDD